MAWTKKTGTLPDKIDTLIVYDTSVSKIVDLGYSGASTGDGITATSVTYPAPGGSAWGQGFRTFNSGNPLFADYYVVFSGTNANGKPKWIDAASGGAGGTAILLIQDVGSTSNTSRELIYPAANCPSVYADGSGIGSARPRGGSDVTTGTTAMPTNDTPFGIAIQARRSATAYWKYFYGTKASGALTQEGTTSANAFDGSYSRLEAVGYNISGSSFDAEWFAVICASQSLLSESEMNSILSDPIGTLINTGASAAIPKTAGLFGGPFKRLITS